MRWGNSAAAVGKLGTALLWRNWEQAETESLTKRKNSSLTHKLAL
jgi:hypothetical protein